MIEVICDWVGILLFVSGEIDKSAGWGRLNVNTWHEETVYQKGLPTNRLEHWAVI